MVRHIIKLGALLSIAFALLPLSVSAQDNYQPAPESQSVPGVPKGETTKYTHTSKIFPGTVRDYYVYVPKQYDAAKPACVMIFQDAGGGLAVANVFDNLIAKQEMPVTIAIMIPPGVVANEKPDALPRYNRSYEYDNLGGDYARFLLDEILPEVGKKYNLSTNPNDRALCGLSSGGICAFTTAWERPDQFRRVMSFIGSFTNLRGGHHFPSLIRKMEPKPLRVFMQDGTNDQDIYSGSWFIGNSDVAAGLKFAGYDYKFVTGDGSHSGRQAQAIFPDALRWLWRDYPAPIVAAVNNRQPVMEVVKTGEQWQQVGKDIQATGGIASDAQGNVFVSDGAKRRLYRISEDGTASVWREKTDPADALAFGSNGKLYAAHAAQKRVSAYDANGKETMVLRGIAANALAPTVQGDWYISDARDGKISLLSKTGTRSIVDIGLPGISGLRLVPDQSLLLAAHTQPGKFISSYHIAPNGTLTAKQPYFDLHLPYEMGTSGSAGMAVDRDGRLYVATLSGVQICDQAGRVIAMLEAPEHNAPTQITFGGKNRDLLFVVAGGRVYRRAVKPQGVFSFETPIKPTPPRL